MAEQIGNIIPNSLAEDTNILLRENFHDAGVSGIGLHERRHKRPGTRYELCDENAPNARGPPSSPYFSSVKLLWPIGMSLLSGMMKHFATCARCHRVRLVIE